MANSASAGTSASDLDGMAETEQAKRSGVRSAQAVRPTVRLRSDGRSRVELAGRVGAARQARAPGRSRRSEVGHARAGRPAADVLVPRRDSTLIIDPEAGAVTYSVGEEHRSVSGGKARQMAFLRDRVAAAGTAKRSPASALTDDTRRSARRMLEPFALAHSRASNDR